MSRVDPAEYAVAQDAMGKIETRVQILDEASIVRFSIAIGDDGDVRSKPPVLAHWAWFLPQPKDEELGPDGHLARGGFLPAFTNLPRRMFASTRIEFRAPLALNVEASATTRITGVTHKSGRSGDLVFVEVEKIIAQHDRSCIVETQTVVYREAGDGTTQPLPVAEGVEPLVPEGCATWVPTATHLFRFSAATFNSHRIHYDAAYARDVEGYPALIVHGPFIAARLAELAAADGALASFEFRASNPSFVDQPISLIRAAPGEFTAVRCDGAIATTAKATYK